MSIIEHILLFSLLFGVYAFWGKYNANKSGTEFWVAALVPILLYVFVTGSRYWGADYIWYRFMYDNPFQQVYVNEQIAFEWLNQFLRSIGLNFAGAYMVYAFIFIIGAFILLRSYGEQSMYMYSFLLPATLIFTTNFIRQGFGMGLVFLALVFFQKRKWLYLALTLFIAFNLHSVTVVTFAIILGIFFVFRKPIHLLISIPLLLFFTFAFDGQKLSFIADLLSDYIDLGSGFQGYIDDSDIWFGEDAFRDTWTKGTLALIQLSVFNILVFYLGNIALKIRENKQVIYIYNAFVLGAILQMAVYNFEILQRFTLPMEMLYFIPLGYICYVYSHDIKNHRNIRLRKYFHLGIIIILAYLFKEWGKFIFSNPNADFFWYHLDDVINPQNLIQW